ncbi:glutamic-type intramembrane protease PrsW [Rummeliibacillus sp. G93]|uniref:glutamic-type intramembrane protease PrsW n=1 Tax=Rummeliibacillus TaxID=648802 RepID=UPI00116E8543|nr:MULTISPECIES: glutamic-type intramembrane protease PrsW [Rummeliibacillus]MBB5169738.1 RsiW-degrading membrane proteinase PrsW (M82 family) [Rummeliibacillus stabekisii]UQW98516.1 glutamic-type intramembrane protease PrsW [Rummeliibacillus sp. G93]GEL03996.1 protease PrsW [Rummeliibacillus stabekisii]
MFVLLSVSIAPALALFSFFYLRNQMATEPRTTLFHTFIYGAILTFPILFLQFVVNEEKIFSSVLMQDVLFSGVVEEFFKWFILLIAIYHHIEFDDPYDGVLYGVSISLGFATVENILYILSFGLDTAFMRALMPVSSHALFGVVMGYYLGRAKFTGRNSSIRYQAVSLALPMLLHIIFNFILTIEGKWAYIMLPFMLFLWWFALRKVKIAHKQLVQMLAAQQKF